MYIVRTYIVIILENNILSVGKWKKIPKLEAGA